MSKHRSDNALTMHLQRYQLEQEYSIVPLPFLSNMGPSTVPWNVM